MPKTFTFQDYWDELENAGPAFKEKILAAADKDHNISLGEFAKLKAWADAMQC